MKSSFYGPETKGGRKSSKPKSPKGFLSSLMFKNKIIFRRESPTVKKPAREIRSVKSRLEIESKSKSKKSKMTEKEIELEKKMERKGTTIILFI